MPDTVKLLKAPEPDSEEFVMMLIEMPKWHFMWFGPDGLEREEIGPLEVREMAVFIRRNTP